MKKFEPISKTYPHMLFGGDYNPEQWVDYPGIIDEDIKLMKLSNCNVMSIGIFSWSKIEPQEGIYDFTFLDEIMDKFEKNNIKAVMATPSGARPPWMSKKYPEVLRVNSERVKNLHGFRHNHCYTSPYYRQKTQTINRMIAERYKNSPSLILWHVSNEYNGQCHCELCQDSFRTWLKERYENDLDKLNHAYWATFWSHKYTAWDQIESPSPLGDIFIHGLNLDWKRFVSHQTIEFMKSEITPLKEVTPNVPVTTNIMGTYEGVDYFKLKDHIDIISWNSYPVWHSEKNEFRIASDTAFLHDLNRSFKQGKPFMLMESTPSCVNWHDVNKLKRPNMNKLSSIQAIAHGSDSVQYFQWRKSRGASEKLHGAIVDHCGHKNTRVFREVTDLGQSLSKLDDVVGTSVQPEVAIIFDWENRWALDDMRGIGKNTKKYEETCKQHYAEFWKKGINVDIIDSECDFSKYKLIVAPMLYMIKPNVGQKIKDFVYNGGSFVSTYVTGWVDESDLCFLGGFPGDGLMDVFGIWAEEIDALYAHDKNIVESIDGKSYEAVELCEIIHAQTADILARYTEDFYAQLPALTCNNYGDGYAYYIAFRDTGAFVADFYEELIEKLDIKKVIDAKLPNGVTAHTREDENYKYIFIENYNTFSVNVPLPKGIHSSLETGESRSSVVSLPKYGYEIVRVKK